MQADGAVGVDIDVVDVIDLQVAAVDIDIDGETTVVVGGVDREGDESRIGVVVALFKQLADDARAFGGDFLLVVGVAGFQRRALAPAVEQASDGVVLRVVDDLVDDVALRRLDMVADVDFFLANLKGVECDGGMETPLRFHQFLQLLRRLGRLVLVVDDRCLTQPPPIVAPDGVVFGTCYAIEP